MFRLIFIILIFITFSYANKAVDFKNFFNNMQLLRYKAKIVKVNIVTKKRVDGFKHWEFYRLLLSIKVDGSNTIYKNVKSVFVNGDVIADSLTNMKTLKIIESKYYDPPLTGKEYNKKVLAAGNMNAKNKLLVFSDPQCPYCKKFVPKALKYAKGHPKKLAVFYYNFDIGVYPNSKIISQLTMVAKDKGIKDVELRVYTSTLTTMRANSDDKVIKKFNSVFNLYGNKAIKKSDITPIIVEKLEKEKDLGTLLGVEGTPTFFYNGQFMRERDGYMR